MWRWLTDSETNLRTLRLRPSKEASLRREEGEEAMEQQDRLVELEEDNKALARELKEALRGGEVESRLAELEQRTQVRICLKL